MIKRKLAIITTHPIQYNAPLFAMLAKRDRIAVKVFYTWGEEVLEKKYDPGFNKNIAWDIPLLEGYDYMFVKNVAGNKGSHHFKGIDNPDIIEDIDAWNADALLVYGWSFESHLKVLRRFHGKIPVLFRGDSVSIARMPFLKKLARNIFLKWVYRHISYALYVGAHNKSYFKELGLSKSRLVFAPHAVDNARFKSVIATQNEQVEALRQSLGIMPGEIVFLYAGKLDENKNVGLLAQAFSALNQQNAHLVIAGNGIQEQQLKRDFEENSNIHFLPFQNQSEMPVLYGIADVFVLPSLTETWGLAINEAMACGKAILASSTCGAAIDLVKNGENGYIFLSNDNNDLLLKLTGMAADKDALIKMGARSAEMIKDWSFEETAGAIEDLVIKNWDVKENFSH